MFESVVKLQGRPSSNLSIPCDRAFSRSNAEQRGLRPPAATYLPRRDFESYAFFAPIGIDHSANAQSGSQNPEKEPLERHSPYFHNLPYNHSEITLANHEEDGDDDRPKEQAVWILVGNLKSGKIPSHLPIRNQQIYLSALLPLLALLMALYTLLMAALLLLLYPLCFCLKHWPTCAPFRHVLSPLLVFQLGLVYSSYDIVHPVRSKISGIMVVVSVSMLSPLYSMAIAVATWVAGAF
ncbi:MAG: hypothetical protein ALECFALPRED_008798 [Alectoria fallacina]|uniref:Uncharacterized protein n=1 Tax=Alectoria fallacina TaxID=1903189 RepID=A0A8H3J4U3_9LECA|nr:MAG: hypothetical protein ALECFALPRED_008798 [Alectoria fallacina]